LPKWLKFDSKTYTFSGTPPSAGVCKIKIRVSDSIGGSMTQTLFLTIKPAEEVILQSVK
jgi:hypothetical protein